LSIIDTHLYGKYKDTLLITTEVNANSGLYSLAYAVVGDETKEN